MPKPVSLSDQYFWLGRGWDLAMCGDHSLAFLTFHMSIGYIGYVSSQKLDFIWVGKNWIVVFGWGMSSFHRRRSFKHPGVKSGWVDNDWKNEQIPQGHGRGKKYEIIGKIRRRCFLHFAFPLETLRCSYSRGCLNSQRRQRNKLDLNTFWRCFWRIFSLFISGCCSVIRRNGKYFYFTFFFLNYCQVINLSNRLSSPDRTELPNVFTDH